MTRLLFEDTLALGLLLAVLLAILAGIWTRLRTPGAWRALCAGLACAALLLAVQAWVVTDREKLESTVRQMSSWVEEGNVRAIVNLIDPAASFTGGRNRADFEKHLVRLLDRYDVKDPSVGKFEITRQAGEATLTSAAFCQIALPQGTFPVRSKWQLRFRLADGEWRIVDLRPVSIMDRPCESFFDID
jgi:hypothetical protein